MLQWTFWFVFSWIKTQKVIWELCYNLLRTVHILFPHGCTNLYADWGQCSHFFHTFFSTFSILKGFRGYAFLVFQSKSVSDTEHVFMDMLPIGMSSFEKHLFRFFTLKKLLFVNCCIVLLCWFLGCLNFLVWSRTTWLLVYLYISLDMILVSRQRKESIKKSNTHWASVIYDALWQYCLL